MLCSKTLPQKKKTKVCVATLDIPNIGQELPSTCNEPCPQQTLESKRQDGNSCRARVCLVRSVDSIPSREREMGRHTPTARARLCVSRGLTLPASTSAPAVQLLKSHKFLSTNRSKQKADDNSTKVYGEQVIRMTNRKTNIHP